MRQPSGNSPKFFRIATEGATSDGRVIDADRSCRWPTATTRTPTARINLEHIRGIDPSGLFKAYGDVTALKAEADSGNRLYAQLDPTGTDRAEQGKAEGLLLDGSQPDFADSGEAYLVALAVTDNPASLGCEMLQFSTKAKVNPLAERKQDPDNVFSEAVAIDLDFSTELNTPTGARPRRQHQAPLRPPGQGRIRQHRPARGRA
jgi:hypothetical protein